MVFFIKCVAIEVKTVITNNYHPCSKTKFMLMMFMKNVP